VCCVVLYVVCWSGVLCCCVAVVSSGLNHATDVVVSGCSAGGLATYLHADKWAQNLPITAHVVAMPDSGFFLDFEAITGPHSSFGDYPHGKACWTTPPAALCYLVYSCVQLLLVYPPHCLNLCAVCCACCVCARGAGSSVPQRHGVGVPAGEGMLIAID
jgi:hypothetical protein